jgi:hypothetical protein
VGQKISDGQSVRVSVPAVDAVVKGNFYLYDGFFGMAFSQKSANTAAAADVILNIEECEYQTSQITVADAFAKGALVYYDNTTKLLTTVVGTNRLVGRVTVAKDADNNVFFKLGPQI